MLADFSITCWSKHESSPRSNNLPSARPMWGESNIEAGKRRLQEEMGFSTDLKDTISFIYKAPFDNGLTEHEFDHILVGYFEGEPNLNPDEVAEWKWMSLEAIEEDMQANPSIYTEWFKIIFDKYYSHIQQ